VFRLAAVRVYQIGLFAPLVWVLGSWFSFALRCVALLCAVYVQLRLLLFPVGGPFFPSLYVKVYVYHFLQSCKVHEAAPSPFRPHRKLSSALFAVACQPATYPAFQPAHLCHTTLHSSAGWRQVKFVGPVYRIWHQTDRRLPLCFCLMCGRRTTWLQVPSAHLEKSTSSSSVSPLGSGRAPPLPLTLLEGQCVALTLLLENIGKFDIDRLAVDVHSTNNVLSKYSKERHPLVPFTGAPFLDVLRSVGACVGCSPSGACDKDRARGKPPTRLSALTAPARPQVYLRPPMLRRFLFPCALARPLTPPPLSPPPPQSLCTSPLAAVPTRTAPPVAMAPPPASPSPSL
jgi:hypothetical protein